MKMTIDDPRLTAYALGELPAAQKAEVENFINNNAEALEFVNDVKATALLLEAEFKKELELALLPQQVRLIRQHFHEVNEGLFSKIKMFFAGWQIPAVSFATILLMLGVFVVSNHGFKNQEIKSGLSGDVPQSEVPDIAPKTLIILGLSDSYDEMMKKAKELSEKTKVPYFAGTYFGRRNQAVCGRNQNCISVEKTDFYPDLPSGQYVIVGAVMNVANVDQVLLETYRKIVPDAFLKTTNITDSSQGN